MGQYLNPSKDNFSSSLNSEIYIDKSALIQYTNAALETQQRYLCISRPRRFGKSMAAHMLSAYYAYTTDADELFHGLKIQKDASYPLHKNKYDVLLINMQEFLSA